jgi:hypothetical protein
MKFDQQELEQMVLAHITKSAKSLDKTLSRQITDDHFCFIEENEKSCYTKALFKLVKKYFDECGGLLTTFVLESKLNEINAKPKIKGNFFALWEEIQAIDIDDNDLHELLSLFKHRRSLRLMSRCSQKAWKHYLKTA